MSTFVTSSGRDTQEKSEHARSAFHMMLKLAHEDAERQRRFKQAGRNDPCPCGSGRTFKKCHGASPEVPNG